MGERAELLDTLGGEPGCKRLVAAFYARVGTDPLLRPLFPGKSLRCATEEFAAFLSQFLGGDDAQTHYRWWLSLRESHARFRISLPQRDAWVTHMVATLDATALDAGAREALQRFFVHSSAYLIGQDVAPLEHPEVAERWHDQRVLDDLIAALAAGHDADVLALAPRFRARPSVFVGLLARMAASGRAPLTGFVLDAVQREPALAAQRFSGRTLLHFACGGGCLEVVVLLRLGLDPNVQDRGGHTPLYAVANGCARDTGPEIVRALVQAGADANACGGITQATPLHMAARRGHADIARALLDGGAALEARDRKGATPLQRAISCRRPAVARLLRDYGASA